MFKISKEAKVGFTVLVGFVILIWGINFLKGRGLFVGGQKFVGLYSRIDGLTDASPIYYRGYKIGSVRAVEYDQETQDIVVTMTLNKKIPFPKNTVAQIYSLDLMGSKGIRFLYGDSDQFLEEGDTIATSVAGDLADQVSQEVLPLKDKAEHMIVKIDSLLTNINSLFDDKNKGSISQGIQSFGATMKNLEEVSGSINKSLGRNGALSNTLANVDSFTMVLNQNGKTLTAMMNNLEDVTGQLKEAHIDSLAGEMSSVMAGVNTMLTDLNDGKGSVGKLLKDEELYNNLNEVAVSLDRLLNDVRHQPGRYVHFSAVNFGGDKAPKEDNKTVVYKVQLEKSKSPLDLRGLEVVPGQTVKEDRNGKYYLYTIGEETDYNKIIQMYQSIVSQFPNAEVIALQGGKQVKISKVK